MSKEEYRPQPSKQPEQPQQERGSGSPGIPPRVHERANPPPESRAYPTLPQKSPLNRAVERTRDLYERNGWAFLPFSEAGEISPILPSRPPTTIFSAPSRDHLLEEPKNPANSQPAREAGKGSPKLSQVHKLLRTLNDREAEVLRSRFGIPREQLSPDSEAILRILGPNYDKPENDDQH